MSRDNSKRVRNNDPMPPPMATPVPPIRNQQRESGNSLDIASNLPPDIVDLPSAGRFYDKDSTLYEKSEIEIKQLTAREEDILASPELIRSGTVFFKLLESIIIDKSINPNDLLIGDRNAILMKSRINAYGPAYSVMTPCDNCNQTTQHDFDLNKCVFDFEVPEIEGLEYVNNLYRLKLPRTGVMVSLKLMTLADTAFLTEQERRKKKLGLESSPIVDFLRNVVVDADGHQGELLNRFLAVLPAYDTRKIRSIYSKIIPDITTKQTVHCSSCSWESEKEVWFDLNFFWPEL